MFAVGAAVTLLVADMFVTVAAKGTLLRGWSPRAAKPAVTAPTDAMFDFALDEPHHLLYGSDRLGDKVWVLSVPTLSPLTSLDLGPQSQPVGLDLTKDGTILAVARHGTGDIVLIDTASLSIIGTLHPPGGPSFDFSPWDVRFGRPGRLYSAGRGTSGAVHVFDVGKRVEVGHSAPIAGDANWLVVTADGTTLYDTEVIIQERVARYDITTDTPVGSGATPENGGGTVAIKPDGSRVYRSSGEVWAADLQTRLGSLPVPSASQCITYLPGADMVVAGCQLSPGAVVRANGTTFAAMGSRQAPLLTAMIPIASGMVAYVSTFAGLEVISFDAPDAPTGVTARAGIGSALASWTPPADQGTTPITAYDVMSSKGGQVSVPATQTSVVLTGLPAVDQTFTVDAVNASGVSQPSTPSNFVAPQAGGTYHPLSPTRILDTRDGTGGTSSPIGPGGTLTLQVTGRGGVPMSGGSAVVLNVTVTNTSASSFLTVWPEGTALPEASNLNWVAGETRSNLVEVALGNGGALSVFNLAGSTDVVADVEGYVGDSTNSSGPEGMFNGLTPSRLLDTRTGGGPLGNGQTLTLRVAGMGGVPPTGVSAVVLNVTVTDTSASSFLTVYPSGGVLPLASNLNWVAGQTVPNRVIVKVGAGGQVSIFNLAGSTDVVVDVNGWFTDATSTAGGSGFVATSLGRFDTRNDPFCGPPDRPCGPLPGGFSLKLFEPDPRTKTALVLNVTATDTTTPSFLTVWPADTPRPLASDLNWVAGETVPNLVVVELNNSAFQVFNQEGLVDVVVDFDGFYSGTVQPVSLTVTRAAAITGSARVTAAASLGFGARGAAGAQRS